MSDFCLLVIDDVHHEPYVSSSKDAVIRVWDRKTLNLHRTLRGHEGPVNAVGLQTGRVVRIIIFLLVTVTLLTGDPQVSASGDGKMILWDIDSGERLRTFEGHDRGLACIEFKVHQRCNHFFLCLPLCLGWPHRVRIQ